MKEEYAIISKESNTNKLIAKTPLILAIFKLKKFFLTPNEPPPKESEYAASINAGLLP